MSRPPKRLSLFHVGRGDLDFLAQAHCFDLEEDKQLFATQKASPAEDARSTSQEPAESRHGTAVVAGGGRKGGDGGGNDDEDQHAGTRSRAKWGAQKSQISRGRRATFVELKSSDAAFEAALDRHEKLLRRSDPGVKPIDSGVASKPWFRRAADLAFEDALDVATTAKIDATLEAANEVRDERQQPGGGRRHALAATLGDDVERARREIQALETHSATATATSTAAHEERGGRPKVSHQYENEARILAAPLMNALTRFVREAGKSRCGDRPSAKAKETAPTAANSKVSIAELDAAPAAKRRSTFVSPSWGGAVDTNAASAAQRRSDFKFMGPAAAGEDNCPVSQHFNHREGRVFGEGGKGSDGHGAKVNAQEASPRVVAARPPSAPAVSPGADVGKMLRHKPGAQDEGGGGKCSSGKAKETSQKGATSDKQDGRNPEERNSSTDAESFKEKLARKKQEKKQRQQWQKTRGGCRRATVAASGDGREEQEGQNPEERRDAKDSRPRGTPVPTNAGADAESFEEKLARKKQEKRQKQELQKSKGRRQPLNVAGSALESGPEDSELVKPKHHVKEVQFDSSEVEFQKRMIRRTLRKGLGRTRARKMIAASIEEEHDTGTATSTRSLVDRSSQEHACPVRSCSSHNLCPRSWECPRCTHLNEPVGPAAGEACRVCRAPRASREDAAAVPPRKSSSRRRPRPDHRCADCSGDLEDQELERALFASLSLQREQVMVLLREHLKEMEDDAEGCWVCTSCAYKSGDSGCRFCGRCGTPRGEQ